MPVFYGRRSRDESICVVVSCYLSKWCDLCLSVCCVKSQLLYVKSSPLTALYSSNIMLYLSALKWTCISRGSSKSVSSSGAPWVAQFCRGWLLPHGKKVPGLNPSQKGHFWVEFPWSALSPDSKLPIGVSQLQLATALSLTCGLSRL